MATFEVVGGWRRSAGAAASSGLFVGGVLALLAVAVVVMVRVLSQAVYVGVLSGLWAVFTAVVVGRFASSARVAVSGAAGLLAGIGIVLGLGALVLRVLPEFLVVFVPQGLVVVGAAVAAAQSRKGLRWDPVWAGLAVGMLGGVVVMLWQLGHTGRAVLVVGVVLVAVTVVLLVRRIWQVLVVVPVAAVVAVAFAQVYALVPAAVDRWFPVLAG